MKKIKEMIKEHKSIVKSLIILIVLFVLIILPGVFATDQNIKKIDYIKINNNTYISGEDIDFYTTDYNKGNLNLYLKDGQVITTKEYEITLK